MQQNKTINCLKTISCLVQLRTYLHIVHVCWSKTHVECVQVRVIHTEMVALKTVHGACTKVGLNHYRLVALNGAKTTILISISQFYMCMLHYSIGIFVSLSQEAKRSNFIMTQCCR